MAEIRVGQLYVWRDYVPVIYLILSVDLNTVYYVAHVVGDIRHLSRNTWDAMVRNSYVVLLADVPDASERGPD